MNDTLKTGIIAAVVAIVVTLGVWALLPAKTANVGAAALFGNTSTDGSQAILPNPTNYDYLVARVALGLGTNLTNSNTGAGNVNIEAQKQNMVSASTTVCAIANPFNATSTVSSFAMNITTGTTTATSYAIGTSTTAFATTTTMETAPVASGAQATITWDPGVNNSVIGPGQFIVVGNAVGQVFYPFAAAGTCSATFQSV